VINFCLHRVTNYGELYIHTARHIFSTRLCSVRCFKVSDVYVQSNRTKDAHEVFVANYLSGIEN